MPGRILDNLEGVSETLLMTLYVRARESQRPNAMLIDEFESFMGFEPDYPFCK